MSQVSSIRKKILAGEYREARDEISKYFDSGDIQSVIFSSEIELLEGSPQKALALLENGITRTTGLSKLDFYIYILKTNIYGRLGLHLEASEELRNAKKCYDQLRSEDLEPLRFEESEYFKIKGNIELLRTNLSESLKSYHRSLEIVEQLHLEDNIAGLNHNIGMVYDTLGDYATANSFFTYALTTWKKLGNKRNISFGMDKLVRNLTKLNRRREAADLLLEFEKLVTSSDLKFAEVMFYLSKGLFLKNSPRLRERFESQLYFRKIIDQDTVDHYTTMYAIIELCQTLIDEIKISHEDEVVEELLDRSKTLNRLAKSFKSINFIFELLLIQSDFALIKKDLDSANQFLEEAIAIAKSYNLTYYVTKAELKQQQLHNEFRWWEKLVIQNSSINDDLQIIDIHQYLHEVGTNFDVHE